MSFFIVFTSVGTMRGQVTIRVLVVVAIFSYILIFLEDIQIKYTSTIPTSGEVLKPFIFNMTLT